MTVSTPEQVEILRSHIIENAEISFCSLKESMSKMGPMQFYAALKFEKIGRDPLDGKEENFIEQLNQMYSDLVVLAAAGDLMSQYPGISLELQLGVGPGYDICATDGLIAAECFAVTTVSSNRKMDKDCKKLMK